MRALPVVFSVLLLSALSFSQNRNPGVPAYCWYGCGPYIPLVTTPILSFTTVSPNPVGATNATGGLTAGATNSTLSEVTGDVDAVYTQPVWNFGGGTPLISPAVRSPLSQMRGMLPQNRPEAAPRREAPPPQPWIYFSAPEQTASVAAAAGVRHPAHNYSNQDVERLNGENGVVHYDGKTEKIQ